MALIEREALIMQMEEKGPRCGITVSNICNFKEFVRMAPTIDPIRAAGGCRCGECRNYVDAYGRGKMMCMRPIRADDYTETGYIFPLELDTKETDFCSYSEPKEAKDDD